MPTARARSEPRGHTDNRRNTGNTNSKGGGQECPPYTTGNTNNNCECCVGMITPGERPH